MQDFVPLDCVAWEMRNISILVFMENILSATFNLPNRLSDNIRTDVK